MTLDLLQKFINYHLNKLIYLGGFMNSIIVLFIFSLTFSQKIIDLTENPVNESYLELKEFLTFDGAKEEYYEFELLRMELR